jgi:chemotaxis protein methyltransferase CheR
MSSSRHAAAVKERPHREFVFADEDFAALRTLVKDLTGINLTDAKRELVYGRLSRRLRALGLLSFRAYRDLLESEDGKELAELCNAITTNLTSFFREAHHFDLLSRHLATWAAQTARTQRMRIWSAGCSTGEEAYSIAMAIAEAVSDWRQRDIRILATDIDSAVLAQGRRGVYAADRLAAMPAARRDRFFQRCTEGAAPAWRVREDLASMITFKQLNLMRALPMRGPLDAIFCRNVIIYFDKDTQRDLFARIAPLQAPGALLFLGHSESLFKVSDDYRLRGKTVYERL